MGRIWHEAGADRRVPVMHWYYSKNSTQLGPVSDDELQAKLACGEVTGTDLVWREGMADWRAVSVVEELRAALVSKDPLAAPMVPAGGVSSPYAPPYAPSYPTSGMPVSLPTSGLAVASLVCGIIGLVTCMLFPGIPAVICGHMALNHLSRPEVRMTGRGMAITGLVMGYLSILVLAGFVVLFIIGVASSSS